MANTPEEKNGKTRTIRNPSLEEIEQLKRTKATEAVTEEEIVEKIEEAIPVAEKKKVTRTQELLPKSSVFEPDSQPFKLVSGNKFINIPGNQIYVRRMGAAEESMFYQLLSNNNLKAINNTMDAVIASCVKSDIDIYELSIIDKLPIFFKILDLTYGPIELNLTCAECGKEYHPKVNLIKDFKVYHLPDNYVYPFKARLTSFPNASIDWFFTYPTIKQSSDYFDSTSIEVLNMLTLRFEGTINENGKDRAITEKDYPEIIKNLNEADTETFKSFQTKFGEYSVDLNFKIKLCSSMGCSLNGREIEKELPIESIFERIIKIQTKK
jgi:hypothetical protein